MTKGKIHWLINGQHLVVHMPVNIIHAHNNRI